MENKSSLVRYIEIFSLMLLTVGPVPPIAKIGMYLLLFAVNIKYIMMSRKNKSAILIVSLMLLSIVADVRNVNESTAYSFSSIAFLLPFVLGAILVYKYPLKEFIFYVERVSFFTVVCSYIGMAFVYVAPNVIDMFPVIDFYGRPVRTIGVFNVILNGMETAYLQRSCGIAFEPGAYQFVVNMGLALTLLTDYDNEKFSLKNYKKHIIYMGGVLLTKSSTGIAIMVVILGIYGFRIAKKLYGPNFVKPLFDSLLNSLARLYKRLLRKSPKRLFLVIAISIVVIVLLIGSLGEQIAKMKSGNFISRFENTKYVVDEYIFDEKFLDTFVVGIGATGYDREYQIDKRIGSWDVYTNYYLRYGLFFSIAFLYLNISLRKISIELLAVIMLSLLTESIVGPIVVMFYYYASESKLCSLCVEGEECSESFMGV